MSVIMLTSALVGVAACGLAGERWWRLSRTRRALAAAQHQATHDRLTGLRNRAGLATAWPTIAGDGQAAVAVLDLNEFKPINDRYGHAAGDQVLTEVAARLTQAAPGIVARLGGDEFAAVLTCTDPYRAAQVLAKAVADPIRLDTGDTVTVAASIGVATPTGADLATALACADAAMYRAKGRQVPVAVYHPRIDERPSLTADPRPGVRVRNLPTQRTAWEVAA